MVPQIINELLHLICNGMGFHQRHALYRILWKAFCPGHGLKQVSPPKSFDCRLGFRYVKREWMFERRWIRLVKNHCGVKQRGGNQFIPVAKDTCLTDVKTARPDPYYSAARLDRNVLTALVIKVRELANEGAECVFDTQHYVRPDVRHRVFQVQHYSGRSGIKHLDDKLRIIGGTGHLISLVSDPIGQLDL